MRKKKELRFISEKQEKAKRFRAFIVAFIAFILVLGSVSTLIFMKSLNFDLQNLLKSPENSDTTVETTTEAAVPVTVCDSAVLLICCDTDNHLTLLAVLRSDAAQNVCAVCALETNTSTTPTLDVSLQTVFEKNGMAGLKSAVSSAYGIQIDRYIKLTESNLKKVVSAVGDVSMEIPESIAYRGEDFSLFLDAGMQTLTGDLFVKYLRFADVNGRSQATAALAKTTLQSLNGNSREKQFNTLFNLSDTDFSIVDLTDTNGLVNVYVALRDTVTVQSLPSTQ
ncbi:MAG: LCP family protein [Candidatus Fimenecus sp.]